MTRAGPGLDRFSLPATALSKIKTDLAVLSEKKQQAQERAIWIPARLDHAKQRWRLNMQTPVEIDFQGMDATEATRAAIAKHLEMLEDRYGRVTACRVVVKGPGGHHHTSGLYEVNIRLALPNGREVNVDRTAQLDERHSDLTFAINDAFKRARRQLQDQARRLQGHVKTHEAAQPIGTVVRLDTSGEFGFLADHEGREIYFHHNSVLDGAFNRLTVGTRVTFAEEQGEKGPQASTVRLLGKHALRA
ncbi:MAG TPA: HPF/RaiA family ribosome-associated protein [Xanthobacteraceae bacterium]|nr:HPF/RaiA family ribosome-associated protein [Xanthobacteraceae bacterium]